MFDYMKSRNLLGISFLFLFVVLHISCSDDDKLYFTRNELMGDIVTENEIPLSSNEMAVTSHSAMSFNIRGNSGECTATSTNENVVSAEMYNGNKKSVTIYTHGVGTAIVTVKDAKGRTASLTINVSNLELSYSVLKNEVVVKGDLLTIAQAKELEEKALSSASVKVGGGYRFVFADRDLQGGDVYLYPETFWLAPKQGTFERVSESIEDDIFNFKYIVTIDGKVRNFIFLPYDMTALSKSLMPIRYYQFVEDVTDKYKPEYGNLEQLLVTHVFEFITN